MRCNSVPKQIAAKSIHLWSSWPPGQGGQLDWWVKNARNGGVAYAVQTVVNGGQSD